MTKSQHVYLFVYGSLRPGWKVSKDIPGATIARRALQLQARHLGSAQVNGQLYDLGDYPGLRLEDSGHQTIGDLYEILDLSLLTTLDRYEGCDLLSPTPHEYRRIQVMLESKDIPFPHPVWVYEWILEQDDAQTIPGGDWLKR